MNELFVEIFFVFSLNIVRQIHELAYHPAGKHSPQNRMILTQFVRTLFMSIVTDVYHSTHHTTKDSV